VNLAFGYKVQPEGIPAPGSYSVPADPVHLPSGATITISNVETVNGRVEFDWSSDVAWSVVMVKQANGGLVYRYDPAVTHDENVQTVAGQNSGGISHVNFCGPGAVPPVACEFDSGLLADDEGCVPPVECEFDSGLLADDEGCVPPAQELEPTIEVTILTPVCDHNIAYLSYAVEVTNVSQDEIDKGVDITWINPAGDDVAMTGLPFSGKVLWPGMELDADGNPVDWPGWHLDGDTWVEGDEWSWTRPLVDVRFAVNPQMVVSAAYPQPTAACEAAPPEVDGNVVGRLADSGTPRLDPPSGSLASTAQVRSIETLPRTGADSLPLATVGGGLVVLGLLVLGLSEIGLPRLRLARAQHLRRTR
jgi:hypothetical protein